MSLAPATPLIEIKGIGPRYAAELASRSLHTAADLLLHLPCGWVDLTRIEEEPGEGPRAYRFTVERVRASRRFGRRPGMASVSGRIGAVPVELVFFHQPYRAGSLERGETLIVHGTARPWQERLQLVNPQTFPAGMAGTRVPEYEGIGPLTSGRLRRLIAVVLDGMDAGAEDDFLPEPLARRHGFAAWGEALRAVHRPGADVDAAEAGRRRFAYAEFLRFQLDLQAARAHFHGRPRRHRYRLTRAVRSAITGHLPFALTAGQEQAFADIVGDLTGDAPMLRLLQGEVGSGKTVVAFLALLLACENGHQGAFVAPTEILAGQHFAGAQRFFRSARLALLTGATPAAQRAEICARLQRGEIDIVFGTHALLSGTVRFRRLGLAVVDEQHRFGVAQRAALACKGEATDLLVTTATPIPRTLLLTLYNDLAVSRLAELPPGRSPVVTRVVEEARRAEFYRHLQGRVAAGERGYVVVPLVEPSDWLGEVRSLAGDRDFFRGLFAEFGMAAVSGQSPAPAKEKALADFRRGRVRVLLATTVVEVGMDVPEATFMAVENADRFGLAQLHQLRGRVGRGSQPSRCWLLASPAPTAAGRARLETLASSRDGFAIAEMDLQMRGGGLISGLEQSGVFDFRIGDAKRDLDLLRLAGDDARQVLEDPRLQTPAIRRLLQAAARRLPKLSFS